MTEPMRVRLDVPKDDAEEGAINAPSLPAEKLVDIRARAGLERLAAPTVGKRNILGRPLASGMEMKQESPAELPSPQELQLLEAIVEEVTLAGNPILAQLVKKERVTRNAGLAFMDAEGFKLISIMVEHGGEEKTLQIVKEQVYARYKEDVETLLAIDRHWLYIIEDHLWKIRAEKEVGDPLASCYRLVLVGGWTLLPVGARVTAAQQTRRSK